MIKKLYVTIVVDTFDIDVNGGENVHEKHIE